MMRKKIVSLCMALALCLSLLPATALAAEPRIAYDTLRIGNTLITGSGYWTTDGNGNLTASDASNYNVAFDADTNTLSLNNATIVGSYDANNNPEGTGIYAGSRSGAVSLTIQVTGNNVVSGSYGIYALSNGGEVSVTISGGGSLTASGSQNGISIVSEFSNAALAIEGTALKASGSYDGVLVQAGESSSGSLSVDGGSLTASGNTGIEFWFSTGMSGSGTPSLIVTGNAVVDAKSGGIAHNSSNNLSIQGNSGMVFNGSTGTVYGNASLQKDLIIGEGESLNIPSGASLTIPEDKTLTVDGGTLNKNGTMTGDVIYKVTGVSLDKTSLELTEGKTAQLTATVKPDNATNKNVTWTSNNTDVATVVGGTVTAVAPGTATITVTTADGGETATCVVTVTAATVPVTGVTLSQTQASLYYNRTPNTLALTATVAPDTATNQAVTWTSSDSTVATVDQNGVVTAVACGTAVITAAAADGSGASASCTVTVSSYLPPANPNYRITVEATQGGTVTADPTAAKAGATVTLTPVPHRGYQVGSVAVTDRFGEPVAVTEQADGTYTFTMPNGQVTVTVTFAEAPLPFPDVTEGDWFYDAVRYAYETGLMDGVGDNLFAPNSQTTRAQLVTILYRLAGQPAVSGDLIFTDVEVGTWYTDAVAWAAENGIVNGTTDATFAPGEDITRGQLVTVLYRYAESKGYDVSASADLSGYPDAGQVQAYAQPAMAWAVAEGIVEGMDGNLNPAGNATRAQIATILMRFCEGVAK